MTPINFTHITPAEYKKFKNFKISYGIFSTRFGKCLIGVHNNKICHLSFHDDDNKSILENLKSDWPLGNFVEDDTVIQPYVERVFERKQTISTPLNVLLKGTTFQCDVWKELAKLHEGSTVTYEYVAKAVGKPTAIRAVASAIARNKVAYIIPCHRVIHKSARISKYRWGEDRKRKILTYESCL